MKQNLYSMSAMRVLIWAMLFFCTSTLSAQDQGSVSKHKKAGGKVVEVIIVDGDTCYHDWILPGSHVYAKASAKALRIAKKRNRLRYNVYTVYPYVLSTVQMLQAIDSAYAVYGDSPQYKSFKKNLEKQLMAKYKPMVKEMTYSQGKVIVLLINRESGRPCYDVIRELKGGVQATVWQGVAKLFDNDLKRTYDPIDRDREIEMVVEEIKMGIPY